MSRLAQGIQQQWTRITVWHMLLLPLSGVFALLSYLRRLFYRWGIFRSYRVAVPVIVVGNITVGGTGKTPLVIWLAEKLRDAGLKPLIISRGYGRNSQQPVVQVTAQSDVYASGDEPALIARKTGVPVWVGRDRIAVAEAALPLHPECNVVISDDGLQHYRLYRDIEIAVVDASRQFGNGLLLPAGPLRECKKRLAQVDAIVVNGGVNANTANNMPYPHVYGSRLQNDSFRNLYDTARVAKIADLADRNLHAVAGIGNPQRFFDLLTSMGLHFTPHAFPDHHAYQRQDLDFGPDATILMTEKDAVKCAVFAGLDAWQLPVNAVPDDALLAHILSKLGIQDGR